MTLGSYRVCQSGHAEMRRISIKGREIRCLFDVIRISMIQMQSRRNPMAGMMVVMWQTATVKRSATLQRSRYKQRERSLACRRDADGWIGPPKWGRSEVPQPEVVIGQSVRK